MSKPKLIAWIFLPHDDDLRRNWKPPQNYLHASCGEVRLLPESQTPLSNEELFEPGWKRMLDVMRLYDLEEDA